MAIFTQFGKHLIHMSLLFLVFSSLSMAVLAAIEGGNIILAVLSLVRPSRPPAGKPAV